MNDQAVIRAMGALAQVCRLRVFRSLVSAGAAGLTPNALSQALGVPPSTLSFHLKELSAAGLVSQERSGRSIIYRAELRFMNALMVYLSAPCNYAACCGPDAVMSEGTGRVRLFG